MLGVKDTEQIELKRHAALAVRFRPSQEPVPGGFVGVDFDCANEPAGIMHISPFFNDHYYLPNPLAGQVACGAVVCCCMW